MGRDSGFSDISSRTAIVAGAGIGIQTGMLRTWRHLTDRKRFGVHDPFAAFRCRLIGRKGAFFSTCGTHVIDAIFHRLPLSFLLFFIKGLPGWNNPPSALGQSTRSLLNPSPPCQPDHRQNDNNIKEERQCFSLLREDAETVYMTTP